MNFTAVSKISVGTYTHCIWSCPKIQAYWMDILQDMSKIFGVSLHMDPLSLLLGHPSQDNIVGDGSARLYDILSYAARKNIFLSWRSDKPPTRKNWHKIIMKCFPLEYLSCLLHSTERQFLKDFSFLIWKLFFCSSTKTAITVEGQAVASLSSL